jgi:hypothetical protein
MLAEPVDNVHLRADNPLCLVGWLQVDWAQDISSLVVQGAQSQWSQGWLVLRDMSLGACAWYSNNYPYGTCCG